MLSYKEKSTRHLYNDTAHEALLRDKSVKKPDDILKYREYSTNWQRAFKQAISMNFSQYKFDYLERLTDDDYSDEQLDQIIMALTDNMSLNIIDKFKSPITQARQMFYLRSFYYRRNEA